MCFALTACNSDDDNGIKLTSDMTIDQLKEALKGITSYTKESYNASNTLEQVIVYTDKGESAFNMGSSPIGNIETHAYFVEDNRAYYLSADRCDVTDLSGFDVNYNSFNKCADLDDFLTLLDQLGYTIENNTIVYNLGSGEVIYGKAVLKDFNKSSITIPDAYKDNYKSLQPSKEVLEYEEISDTECRLKGVNISLNSLTVPDKYDEKNVTEISFHNSITTLTIPATVNNILNTSYEENGKYTINYLGTREQWELVNKDNWLMKMLSSGVVTVNCSDGIVDDNIALTENMSIDQLKNALKKVKNFKVATADSAEDMERGILSASRTYCNDGYSFVDYGMDMFETRIYETNRQYRMIYRNEEWSIKAFDYENYDVKDKVRATIDLAQEYLNNTWMPLIEQGFSIKDNMVYFNDGEYRLSSFNDAVLNIPEQYKNYASMSANAKVVDFEEYSANGTDGYALTNTNLDLNSLVIPETYNGKPVISAVIDIQLMAKVTIPVCVKELRMARPIQGNVVEITYLGSRVHWNETDKSQNWWSNDYCTISCADDI